MSKNSESHLIAGRSRNTHDIAEKAAKRPRVSRVSGLSSTAMLLSLLLLGAGGTGACAETCERCKWLNCLKETVVQKQNMIEVYNGLRTFWINRHTDENRQPVMVRNLSNLEEPGRSRVYVATVEQLDEYARMEEQRTSTVAGPEACAYPQGQQQVETDSFERCTTRGFEEFKAVAPCKEIAEFVDMHEGAHRSGCKARQTPSAEYWRYTVTLPNGRQEARYFPPNILTPAGKASEEIAAYQLEVAGLKEIIRKLESRCHGFKVDQPFGAPGGRISGLICSELDKPFNLKFEAAEVGLVGVLTMTPSGNGRGTYSYYGYLMSGGVTNAGAGRFSIDGVEEGAPAVHMEAGEWTQTTEGFGTVRHASKPETLVLEPATHECRQ